MFPIHSDRSPKGEERFRKLVWDMPCEAVAVIKELQPYNRGAGYKDDLLWQLNELAISTSTEFPLAERSIPTSMWSQLAAFGQISTMVLK
jgi:hypothetical protein